MIVMESIQTPGKRRVIKIIAERPTSHVEACIRPRPFPLARASFSFLSMPAFEFEGDESPFTKRPTLVTFHILRLEIPESLAAVAMAK
mmetsp:Transcript_33612/g.51777  ORF Transcript_33612/g.51777 Transcript_33612/m.51777 type:complete len:88 (-) Transcript_33612:3451-3714(-)